MHKKRTSQPGNRCAPNTTGKQDLDLVKEEKLPRTSEDFTEAAKSHRQVLPRTLIQGWELSSAVKDQSPYYFYEVISCRTPFYTAVKYKLPQVKGSPQALQTFHFVQQKGYEGDPQAPWSPGSDAWAPEVGWETQGGSTAGPACPYSPFLFRKEIMKKEPLWERGKLLNQSLRKNPGPGQHYFAFEIIFSLKWEQDPLRPSVCPYPSPSPPLFFLLFFDPTFLFSEILPLQSHTANIRAQVLLLQTWCHAQEWSCVLSGPAVIAAGLCRLNSPPGASGLKASLTPSSILQPAWLCTETHPCSSMDWLCNHRPGLAKDILWLSNHQSCDLKKSAFGDFHTHQGYTLSHETGKEQRMARESQGASRLLPQTQRDLSLLPGDSTSILQNMAKGSGDKGDLK